MRFVWLGVVALSGLVACGAELEGGVDGGPDMTDAPDGSDTRDTFEVDAADTSETSDTGDAADTDTLELDTAEDSEVDAAEVDVTEVADEGDVAEVADEDAIAEVTEDTDAADLAEVTDEGDVGEVADDTDGAEVQFDADVDLDLDDVLADAADVDLSDEGPDLSDIDTTEPIDTVDNPCLFPGGLLPDRYQPMAELRGAELRTALKTFVTDGSVGFDYDAARDLMYGITDAIDVDADLTIECVYTGYHKLADGTRSPGSGPTEITTEHSWPRSDGAGAFPAEGDIHHLFPALAPANGSRGNDEFGDVACGVGWPRSCEWADGGSFLGPAIDGRSTVFEVRPERRGDIARAHFYFAVRYDRPIPALEEETLRRWHCEDPPSLRERARNDRIEVHQKNRNPFVDQPFWVERILDF